MIKSNMAAIAPDKMLSMSTYMYTIDDLVLATITLNVAFYDFWLARLCTGLSILNKLYAEVSLAIEDLDNFDE